LKERLVQIKAIFVQIRGALVQIRPLYPTPPRFHSIITFLISLIMPSTSLYE